MWSVGCQECYFSPHRRRTWDWSSDEETEPKKGGLVSLPSEHTSPVVLRVEFSNVFPVVIEVSVLKNVFYICFTDPYNDPTGNRQKSHVSLSSRESNLSLRGGFASELAYS